MKDIAGDPRILMTVEPHQIVINEELLAKSLSEKFDLEAFMLHLDILMAQLQLNDKEDRLRRYQIAKARERAGDF